MALQLSNGSLWNSTILPAGFRGQSSLIGTTYNAFAQSTAGTVSIAKTTNVNIVTEITAACNGTVSALPNNDTVLTTQILCRSTSGTVTIARHTTLLVIPITLDLQEPTIKDITVAKTIIDSTDVIEKITTTTEVL